MPRTECLKDVIARFLPYWEAEIVPDLREGKVVLVAAHGNSLRALVKHLDGISDEDIAGLNIPTGMPLVYELDEDMRPTVAGGATSTPRRPQQPPPRWRTRVADPHLGQRAGGARIPSVTPDGIAAGPGLYLTGIDQVSAALTAAPDRSTLARWTSQSSAPFSWRVHRT